MMEYLVYFLLTLILSTLFAIAGLGAAAALIPGLNMAGLTFDLARASGLFVNSVTTMTSSYLNFRKKLFDRSFVMPLVISSVLFALIGSRLSFTVETETVKTIFAYTLVFIASMILFFKQPTSPVYRHHQAVLIFSGSIGGLFSGFLGVGGGAIISPILFLLGYDAKKIAIGISFVIPFSSVVAFIIYAGTVELDFMLLLVLGIGAYLGGRIGNHLLHFKVSPGMIKTVLAFALYAIAVKMLFG
jgi:uncharacterized membrane protein YfcA